VDYIYVSPYTNQIINGNVTGEFDYDYCVCKTDIEESTMIYCENDNCPNGQWFHLQCVGLECVPDVDYFCCSQWEAVEKCGTKGSKYDVLFERCAIYARKLFLAWMMQSELMPWGKMMEKG
jgi:hypothetical protein